MSWRSELRGAERDAAAAVTSLLEQYGLGSLANTVVSYVKQWGTDTTTIYTALQETRAWKQRFAANEKRRDMGLEVLSPAEYLATERGIRQALQAAGMPSGMWDKPADLQRFLEADVAPSEVMDRAMEARTLADRVDPEQKRALASRLGLGTGDIAAYYLNPGRALPELQREVDKALLNAERRRALGSYSRDSIDMLFSMGVTEEEARAGYSAIAQARPTARTLSGTRGAMANLTTRDLEDEVFGGSADAATQRRRLASQERARFSGSGGTGADTFSRDRRFN